MAVYTNIEQAIVNQFSTLLAAYPTEFPNAPLSSKGDGIWCAVHNLRAPSAPVTIGLNGEDNHPGVIQVDFNAPYGTGTGTLLTLADSIANAHPAGTILSHSGTIVTITSTSVSPMRKVDGYCRISLSMSYYNRSARA